MAIAFETVASTAFPGGGLTVTIDKPTGLVVGDYMFAQIVAYGGTSWTTLTGWTALYNASPTLGGIGVPCAVLHKIADSADVAASDFTFTVGDTGGVTEQGSGCISRISGMGILDGNVANTSTTSSPFSFASGIDPVYANGLILYFVFLGINSAANVSSSSPSIATNNPTFTSRSNNAVNTASRSVGRTFYTAPRPEVTAFGNVTISFAPAGVVAQSVMVHLVPEVNGTLSVTTGITHIINQPFLRTGVVDVDGVDPTTNKIESAVWTPKVKTATTWTPEIK